MNALRDLQDWYLSQCNEDWEHTYGVSIGTLDNPGWSVEVELTGTTLHQAQFDEQSYGVGENAEPNSNEWVHCTVKDNKFIGYGGPQKLEEIIEIFLSWAKRYA